jgi:AraC family transcriptional regulator, transcriptional activator of the genes for pyochelin and ferripyochelin receptors
MPEKRVATSPSSHLPTWVWPEFAKGAAPAAAPPNPLAPHRFGASFCGSEAICAPTGQGRRDYFAFAGSLLGMHQDFRLGSEMAATVPGEDFLKFHFKMSGNNTVSFPGGDDVNLRAGSMAIAIHPRGVSKLDTHTEGAAEHSLTFACRPALFTQTLRLDPDALPQPIRQFALGQDPQLYLRVMALNARVAKTIEEMLSCPYSGRFSHVHAEARALDLICMVLDVLANDDVRSPVRLTPRDVVALESVREMLNEHFMDPPTIAQISRQIGVNRTKLTQGFRYLFNETILDYCHRKRMQKARELLLGGLPVGTVAVEVGYEHHSSFAQAFRAYFGFPPVELCRRRPTC